MGIQASMVQHSKDGKEIGTARKEVKKHKVHDRMEQ